MCPLLDVSCAVGCHGAQIYMPLSPRSPRSATEAERLDAQVVRLHAAMRPYQSLLLMATGTVASFYGRHFVYSLLLLQLCDVTDRPLRDVVLELSATLRDIRQAVREGRTASDAMRQLSMLSEEATRVHVGGSDAESMAAVLSVTDRLRVVTDELPAVADRLTLRLSALLAVIRELAAKATSHGAAKVGIRRNIGEQLTQAVNDSCGPPLRRGLQRLRDHSDAVDQLHAHPTCRWYLELGISCVLNSIGMALAFHAERAAFVVANAVWGAEVIGGALESLAPSRSQGLVQRLHTTSAGRCLKWIVAASGCYYQGVHGGHLPLMLRLVLFAPLLTERCLSVATLAVRGPLG